MIAWIDTAKPFCKPYRIQIDLWLISAINIIVTFRVIKNTLLDLDSVSRGFYCTFFIPLTGQGALENVAKLTIPYDKRN